jgi:hypothetical protein
MLRKLLQLHSRTGSQMLISGLKIGVWEFGFEDWDLKTGV